MTAPDRRDLDCSAELAARIRAAHEQATPLRIVGGDSKSALGRKVTGEVLPVAGHCGVVEYLPSELVITARAGTPLAELEATLAASGQMLPFEPPHLGRTATLGGSIACGLSGPRRPYSGAARDYVLGVRMINGQGEILSFGGQVMKNVAGYDLSRLQAGAQGTLGVLLEVSLKVLPRPASELTLSKACTAAEAITAMNALAGWPLPLSAAAHVAGRLWLRLSGAQSAVAAAAATIGGEATEEGDQFWLALRERQLPFFAIGAGELWRLSLPPATALSDLPGEWLLDWGGAQRWLKTGATAHSVFAAALAAGGHAACYGVNEVRLAPQPAALAALSQRLKTAFDPAGILNPGRLYPATSSTLNPGN